MLTQIKFDFGKPSTNGVVALGGKTVRIVPTGPFLKDKRIVVREDFDVTLSTDGTASVEVPPTDNTFAYEVTVGNDTDAWSFVRYVQVPNSQTPVKFADLVCVDANTLAPALNTGAALTYLLASSLQEAQAMSAANPGQMVFYPEGQAKTVASQILEDLTDARAVVEAQSAVAAQAANAAQASAVGAQAASVQAADVVQAVSEQTAQVSANAAAVQSVADSITESKTVVESHASEALTAIDEAVKSVKDKASDVTVEDKAKDKTPADATADTTSQEA